MAKKTVKETAKAKTRKSKAEASDLGAIHFCTIRYPDPDQLEYFGDLAVAESPENASLGIDQVLANGLLLPFAMAGIARKKWQNGRTLKVAFLDGTSSQQNFVVTTVAEWSQHANIAFNFNANRQDSDLRISFRRGGAWSYLGTDCLGIPKTQPTMQLGWVDKAVVLHEFGHALYLIHEHQHPEGGIPWNKAAVYRYYSGAPNNWDRATIDSNIFAAYGTDTTQYSAYDARSIMHYAIDAQLLTDPTKAVGFNKELSTMDKEWIGLFYPKIATPPPPPPPPPPGGAWTLKVSGDLTISGTGPKPVIL